MPAMIGYLLCASAVVLCVLYCHALDVANTTMKQTITVKENVDKGVILTYARHRVMQHTCFFSSLCALFFTGILLIFL